MAQDAPRYVRLVLAVHAALLLLVIVVVYLATREIYATTQAQAIAQAQENQALVARQTARGVEDYFDAILDTLDLLRLSEREGRATGGGADGTTGGGAAVEEGPQSSAQSSAESSAGPSTLAVMKLAAEAGLAVPTADPTADPSTGPAADPAAAPTSRPRSTEQLREAVVSGIERASEDGQFRPPPAFWTIAASLWEQLDDRATALIVYNRRPGGRMPGGGRLAARVLREYRDPDAPPLDPLLRDATGWLEQLKGPGVSGLYGDPGSRSLLAAVPLGQDSPLLIVAVIPRRAVVDRFLAALNSGADRGVNATLLDGVGVILGGPDHALVAKSILTDIPDPDFQEFVSGVINMANQGDARPQRRVIDHPLEIGGKTLAEAVASFHPVHVGRQTWWVMVLGSLADVNSVVDDTFSRAGKWAAGLIIAITAILTSTAVQTIKARNRLEKMRTDLLDKELGQARRIQLDWLPPPHGEGKGMKIVAVNEPASHISGDFYDWFDLDDGRTVLTIGDVTGHGMSAAFLMATCQLLVRNTMVQVEDPGRTLEEVNRQLCVQAFNGQFVTMLIAIVDPVAGTMQVSCAGHPPPLTSGPNGFEPLDVDAQLVLGVEADMDFPTQTLRLRDGACLLLYTDGVTEAQNRSGDRYSVEQLAEELDPTLDTADDLARAVHAVVDFFRDGHPIDDDLTYVAVRLEPSPARDADPASDPVADPSAAPDALTSAPVGVQS